MNNKIRIALFFLIFLYAGVKAQTKKSPFKFNEIMLNSFVSGNGFGLQQNPALGISAGKRFVIEGGPVFNKNFQKNTGILLSTKYMLVRDEESYNGHFRLSAVVSFQQMHNQTLTPDAVRCEQSTAFLMKNDEAAHFDELAYKGWELAAGFGCAYRFDFGMILRAEASVCYFSTLQQTHVEISSFRDEKSSSLRIGFGIGWALCKKITPPVFSNEPEPTEQESEQLLFPY
jgi:hypothetical protein